MSLLKMLAFAPAGYLLLVTIVALAVAVRARNLRPILWPLHELAGVTLWLIGWPVCSYLLIRRALEYRDELLFGRRLLEWSPTWAFLWGNNEDGVDGFRDNAFANGEWRKQTLSWPAWRRILIWSAWRNPCGNLRFVVPFGFFIDPARVRSVSGSWGYFAWCGTYSGARLNFGKRSILAGWKIRPEDSAGLADTDYRRKGCGFAFQMGQSER